VRPPRVYKYTQLDHLLLPVNKTVACARTAPLGPPRRPFQPSHPEVPVPSPGRGEDSGGPRRPAVRFRTGTFAHPEVTRSFRPGPNSGRIVGRGDPLFGPGPHSAPGSIIRGGGLLVGFPAPSPPWGGPLPRVPGSAASIATAEADVNPQDPDTGADGHLPPPPPLLGPVEAEGVKKGERTPKMEEEGRGCTLTARMQPFRSFFPSPPET